MKESAVREPFFPRPTVFPSGADRRARRSPSAWRRCGRKGPLDPPPSAVSTTGKQEPANTNLISSPFEKPAGKAQSSDGKAPNKSFILDPLLN